MAHSHGKSPAHSESANGRLVVLSLILFFAMSLIGHYIFIIRDGGHETSHEAGPAQAQPEHGAD
jgi:hypothetical protein